MNLNINALRVDPYKIEKKPKDKHKETIDEIMKLLNPIK